MKEPVWLNVPDCLAIHVKICSPPPCHSTALPCQDIDNQLAQCIGIAR
jgi:hypothetical protein